MSENPRVTIKQAQDGPYLVAQLEQLSNRNGSIECQPSMALCRCGQSANKPFCDGSHKRVGFSSENHLDSNKDRLDSYQGKNITLYDNRSVCAHAGYCTDGLPKVFRHRQQPFVDPDAAAREQIIETVKLCPSGALSYAEQAAEEEIELQQASVFIAPNGPYVVKGLVALGQARGQGAVPTRMTLCRCGASKNKPFCDGSHWEIEFKDDSN